MSAMFFDQEDPILLNPGELFRVVQREIYAISANLEITQYRPAPTHTEDGIPIRKLYVSNLPPKTTRSELFDIFTPYGYIKSCWLRMGERGSHRSSMATYAFITFSEPEDAHKALQAPTQEKVLRGRTLKIYPADSWHQPSEDADGRVRWRPQGSHRHIDYSSSSHLDPQGSTSADSSLNNGDINEDACTVNDPDIEPSYNILDILNTDCLIHIFQYVPIQDLIRSERVSKSWKNMVQEYITTVRTFKTSWWQSPKLTTAVLRRVLGRFGGALLRLHVDQHTTTLNDRTAHTVGKFCPDLEELKVVGMHTRNWNPVHYGCKQLKTVTFDNCNKLHDASLVPLMKNESCVMSLTVANNTHVTGLFLTEAHSSKLHSLSFYNCYSLQGPVLCVAMDNMPNLTTLRLDGCPKSIWKLVPLILKKLPRLEELSLSEYQSKESMIAPHNTTSFYEGLSVLTELKTLNLSKNIFVDNNILKRIGKTCTKLESLNVSCCNGMKPYSRQGVCDEGLQAVCGACRELRALDVSYLGDLGDLGVLCTAHLPRLASLAARGNGCLDSAPFAHCLRTTPSLQVLDLCGCDSVTDDIIDVAMEVIQENPRPITLWLGGTAASHNSEDILEEKQCSKYRQLKVDLHEDRSIPNLRPDQEDRFSYDTDESLDDLYDRHLYGDFDDFDEDDDDDDDGVLMLDDDEMNGFYAYGIHAGDFIGLI